MKVDCRVRYKKVENVRIIRTVDDVFYVQYRRRFLFFTWWRSYFWVGAGQHEWPAKFYNQREALSALREHNCYKDTKPVVVWPTND